MNNARELHDRRLKTYEFNPEILGLTDIVMSFKESKIYNGKNLIAEPDLMFLNGNNTINIIEYKVHDHPVKAKKQLQTAKNYISKYTDWNIKLFYVHDDFQYKEVQ